MCMVVVYVQVKIGEGEGLKVELEEGLGIECDDHILPAFDLFSQREI